MTPSQEKAFEHRELPLDPAAGKITGMSVTAIFNANSVMYSELK